MKTRLSVLVLALSAWPLVASALPPESASASGNSFVIVDARVFDGENDLGIADVLVEGGRIAAVGKGLAVPAGLPVVPARGGTLLPALIDAHTHSWGDARGDALRFGVGTELDMLGDAARLPALRTQRESLARTAQADLWSAGHAVTAPGGHGTQYGMAVPTLAADGDARAFVAARVAEGSDYLKLIVEDMSAHGASTPIPTLSAAQLDASVRAAHQASKLALVHVSLQKDARQALASGADGLVHVFYDQAAAPDLIEAMRTGRAFVVPTLSVVASVSGAGEGARLAQDPQLRPLLSGAQIDALKAAFPGAPRPDYLRHALDSVRALHAAGVDILAGTDAGNPGTAHGASLHGELELLVRAGLSPAQALSAATATPARRFALQDRGRIAPGLRADLLLVKGDPTRDITATRAIEQVWKNGYAVQRAPAAATMPATQGASVPAQALVADFDAGAVEARYGSWQPTTDRMAGGASTVSPAWSADGAGGSKGALRVDGRIEPGFAYPWSGVMFFPAMQPMQPVDLSARSELVFQVRGDGRTYQAMLFSGTSMQGMPSIQSFVAGEQWRQVRVPLAAFAGADLELVRGIAFTAGQPLGDFSFQLDDVEIR